MGTSLTEAFGWNLPSVNYGSAFEETDCSMGAISGGGCLQGDQGVSEDYSQHLTSGGFVVNYIVLIPRPTPLPGNATGWLETFAESFPSTLPPAERPIYIAEVREALRQKLCDADGKRTADHTRLQFAAIKRAQPASLGPSIEIPINALAGKLGATPFHGNPPSIRPNSR